MAASTDSMDSNLSQAAKRVPGADQEALSLRRLLLPLVLVVAYWAIFVLLGVPEIAMFPRFLMRMAALIVLLLGFTVWWLVRGPMALRYRFLVVVWTIACAVVGTLAMDRTVLGIAVWMWTLPVMFSVWAAWLWMSRASTAQTRLAGMVVVPALCIVPGLLVRMEGLKGSGAGDFHWRWGTSAEAQFLDQRGDADAAAGAPVVPVADLVVSEGDWTDFRGPQRDATLSGVRIATDWSDHPPQLVWRTRMGPAWSSIVVVGDRLFTQEQRGEEEVVSCFDANTGQEVWAHKHDGRFEENLGGVGPRATPTFADGRIYALGAAGQLSCLDAAGGELVWSRDIVADASARLPVWGFSGSPLVVDDRVIVFAGGENEQALVAYDAASGEIAWKSTAGTESYASPHLMTIAGKPQVLFVGNEYLGSFDPASGKLLWKYQPAENSGRPVIQPRRVVDSQLLVSFSPMDGITLLDVSLEGDEWQVADTLHSADINPDFSDLVHHDGYIYGFDGDIFCCVDLATGKRQWKKGRYGAGQLLLLTDQPLLLVVTEQGELVLVAVDPAKHEELARFPALSGKTWNHPAISRGKLYVRNAEEMACYELPTSALKLSKISVEGKGVRMTKDFGASDKSAQVLYTNDFEGPVGSKYPEWSSSAIEYKSAADPPGEGAREPQVVTNCEAANGSRRFLGEFGGPKIGTGSDPGYNRTLVDQTIRLTLRDLPPHTALRLSLNLYVLKSWDGNSPQYGPDRLRLTVVSGPVLLDTSFSNNHKVERQGSYQDYPRPGSMPRAAAAATDTLGYDFFGDSLYPLEFTFPHSASDLALEFASSLFEGKGVADESWGLDNVRVEEATPDRDGDSTPAGAHIDP